MKNLQISALPIARCGLNRRARRQRGAGPTTCRSNSFRAGTYTVFYHASADDISGPYVPPGVNIEAQNVETAYFAYIRRLSSTIRCRIDCRLPAAGERPRASVRHRWARCPTTASWSRAPAGLLPAVLLEYRFLSENSPWQPFVGVGVNYTTFYDRDTTAAGNAAFGGPTRLSLTASVGPAATVGVGYHVARAVGMSTLRIPLHRSRATSPPTRPASSAPRTSASDRRC